MQAFDLSQKVDDDSAPAEKEPQSGVRPILSYCSDCCLRGVELCPTCRRCVFCCPTVLKCALQVR